MEAPALTRLRRGRSLLREIAVAVAAIWLLTLAPAVAVAALSEAREALRSRLAFALVPHPGTTDELVGIAATNGRVVFALALAAWARSRLPLLALPADLLVGLIVVANAALVGVAVGAYGRASLPWIVHLPAEWTALAVVLALYRRNRRDPTRTSSFAIGATVALTFVGIGALIETYLTPQR